MKVKRSKISVELLNPLPGGARFVSLDYARRYVARGRAHWEGRKLRIVEDHPAALAARSSAAELVHLGEQGGGMARLEQVQGLPVAGPAIRIFAGTRSSAFTDDPTVVRVRTGVASSLAVRMPPEWPRPRPAAENGFPGSLKGEL